MKKSRKQAFQQFATAAQELGKANNFKNVVNGWENSSTIRDADMTRNEDEIGENRIFWRIFENSLKYFVVDESWLFHASEKKRQKHFDESDKIAETAVKSFAEYLHQKGWTGYRHRLSN